MLDPSRPSLALAPMDGITDAPMRALQGATGAFSYAVSEFIRVSEHPLPPKVFRREVPELTNGGRTVSGMPVQVQLLGGDPDRMALSAMAACRAGATAVDINFGCPAPTVNRNDGGASLLQHPCRIRDIVGAVRSAVPATIPVSAKLRLGWECPDSIHLNAEMAAEGGADWLTIHARTRMQGYRPPVFWAPIRQVREAVGLPVVANGDIWSLDDLRRCQDETGSIHFMLGRGALADPALPYFAARELGLSEQDTPVTDWHALLSQLVGHTERYSDLSPARTVMRLKQWLKLASTFGSFDGFDAVKTAATLDEFFSALSGVALAA
jgi:tRNA-dihydrouridine synthase C